MTKKSKQLDAVKPINLYQTPFEGLRPRRALGQGGGFIEGVDELPQGFLVLFILLDKLDGSHALQKGIGPQVLKVDLSDSLLIDKAPAFIFLCTGQPILKLTDIIKHGLDGPLSLGINIAPAFFLPRGRQTLGKGLYC